MLEVKNLPVSAGDMSDSIRSLDGEGPLEEGTATHSSLLAWRESHGQRSLAVTVHGVVESDTTEAT